MDTTKINHLSLCAGYGGIDLGLRRVLPSMRTIAYVEIEAFACANLVEKIENKQLDEAPLWTNIKTFDARPFCGVVDILSGGFPCQPFSHAGQRKGTDDPRHLFPDIERITRECEPRIVFLENVEGIISSKYGGEEGTSVLKYVLGRLEALGYRATAGIFSAEEVGFPHRRKRVFICGISDTRCDDETTRRQCTVIQEGSDERDAEGRSGCDVGGGLLQEARKSEELGNAEHDGLPPIKELRSDEETGDNWRKEESSTTGKSKGTGGPANVSGIQGCTEGGELAHTNSKHWGRKQGQGQSERESVGECTENDCGESAGLAVSDRRIQAFPSRPSEPQHRWEAPRTIGDEEIITAMGGSAYGSANGDMVHSCRVDALRLLGNGVVPATCEKAFVVLMSKIR